MTSSDDGRPKALSRKQSRLWLALCWAALTIVAVIIALDGRLLWWFIAACFAAFGGYWFYLWRHGK
jgi:Flp pilus assembly protein TadB